MKKGRIPTPDPAKERHEAEVGDLDRAIAEGLRIADAVKSGPPGLCGLDCMEDP